jgi:hypothetical protein
MIAPPAVLTESLQQIRELKAEALKRLANRIA